MVTSNEAFIAWAKEVFTETEYQQFTKLMQLREDPNPEMAAFANEELIALTKDVHNRQELRSRLFAR
ncbi:MAG: hypothetical protein OWR52_00425 [Acidibacillus sp.]|uniref:Uncharacterized protein n=1 Tax=Sulfoacidibacillus ferrooxidans TaxID=2005001 RepID=A0A9X2AEZ3_9BACL|nr:hypothetical protein [Sulfoacidibacillus ferrooxidans]MCI0183521.1 hypothetical protein [Sulfoacidibacillus ferrooxidans]MCY0891970.1 hypothetical protein [Acidibacillus sp.]